MKEVLVTVEGGIIQDIQVPAGVSVTIYDFDTDGVDSKRLSKIRGEDCVVSVWDNEGKPITVIEKKPIKKTLNKNERMANLIRDAADKWEANAQDEDNFTDAKVWKLDADDLRKVAKLLEQGKVSKARCAAQDLDTIVRDEIPEKAWDYLNEDE